jgi:hypothetical protein
MIEKIINFLDIQFQTILIFNDRSNLLLPNYGSKCKYL